MERLRTRLFGLLAALPILIGLLVPSLAFGCAPSGGSDGGMSGAVCECCPKGLPAASGACATLCQVGPSAHAPTNPPRDGIASAWLTDLAHHPEGIDTIPDAPPPR